MNYIRQLEEQNEALRQKLAETEKLWDWHSERLAHKLQFTYAIFKDGEESFDIPISRHLAKYVLTYKNKISMNRILQIKSLEYLRRYINVPFSLVLTAWKDDCIVNQIVLMEVRIRAL